MRQTPAPMSRTFAHLSDEAVVALVARSDEHALAELYDRFGRVAYGLAYRVLLMSTREMGFVQAKKYDLEVWAPGVERWLEVSSCSVFTVQTCMRRFRR